MSGNNGSGTGLEKQMQKVRIDQDGTVRVPTKANGEDGRPVAPAAVAPVGAHPATRLLGRLKLRLARV